MLRKFFILTILTGVFAGGLAFAAKRADASALTARISTAFAAFLPGVAAEKPPRTEIRPENFGSAPCVAGEKTWDGEGATNNWSEAANWTCDAVPLLSDIVIFDATSTKDATIDINTSADDFRLNTGYTGTISTAPGVAFSFGRNIASFFTSSQAAGGFVCGNGSEVTFFKTTFTMTGGNFDCRNGSVTFNVGRININGGTFDAPTGSTILEGFSTGVGSQISLGSGGTFNHNGGTVFVKNAASINSTGQPLVLNNLEAWAQTSLNLPGSVARILGDLNIVDDNITKDGKISGAINSVWELHGNMSVSANVALNTNHFITFAGSGNQTFINSGGVNPSATWRMNKPSGQLILLSDLSNFGSLQLDNGIINAGNFTVSLEQGLVNGGNANSYVIGKVRRQFRAFGAVELFPVGTANGYSPATANFSASGATLTMEAKEGVHPSMNPANSLARYWTVSQTGNANATMTFTYLNGDVNGDENLYAAARINNGSAFLAPVNAATNVITVSGETLFGDFTAGESLAPCVAGQKTWDGEGATNNWSEAANWSCNAVPLTTDRVFFNAASSKNVIFDIPVTRAATTIDASYTGELSAGTTNLTFNGAFTQSGGTFNGGSGTLDFNGDFTLSAGTFIQSSTLNLFSSVNFRLESAGVFNHNNGTFVIDGQLNFVGTAPSVEQFGIRVEAGHNFGSKSMIANEFVELVAGNSSGGNLETRKNLIIHPTFAGVANVVISGNNARTITLPLTANMPRITLDAPNTILEPSEPNGTLTFSNAAFNLLSGTFNANGVNLIINSTFTQSGGTFNGGTGALTFESGGTLTLTGGTFVATSGTLTYNPFGSVLGSAATFDPNGGTFVVNAPTNFNGPATSMNFHNLTTRANFGQGSRVFNVAGTLNHSTGGAGNGLIRASGDVIVGSGVTGGSGSIEFVGNANQSFTNLGGVYPFQNLTINKPSGTVTANSPLALRSASDDLNITSGTLYLASGANVTARNINIAANGRLVNDSSVTLTIGTSVTNDGIVDLQGGGAACNETPGVDPITIISSNNNQKPWNGSGVNRFVDVSVTRMGGTGTKTVFSGTNVTGNNSSWVFDPNCPQTLSISPAVANLQTGQTQAFTAGGGFAPYTFSIATNNSGGSINPSTGVYTAGNVAAVTDTVRVTDAFGQTADATVNVFGIPTQLAFIAQPTTTIAGQTIAPSVQVAVRDISGNTVSNSTAAVTLTIANNPNGGTLTGTVTRNAVNGIATFDDLSIDRAGTGYTLGGQSGSLTAAISGAFDISAGTASQLVFAVQPANTANNAVIAPAVQVAVTDSIGNVVPTAADQITIAIGNNPSTGTLSGTLTQTAVNGVATFSNLAIDNVGGGYTLTATSGTFPAATSNSFNITSLVVTNTNDSGEGSLRQAILDSNSLTGRQSITFNIAGAGPFTITLLSALPQLSDSVAIDASTQPGFPGTPIIEVNGTLVPGSWGFEVRSNDNLIKGFAINRFVGLNSSQRRGAIVISGANNVVEGNFIGIDVSGNNALPNEIGVLISHTPAAVNNRIGGSSNGARNVISGQTSQGISVGVGANNTQIQGNYIGTDSGGMTAIGNSKGVELFGNSCAVENNIISGNGHGLLLNGANNLIRANTIGRNQDNTGNLGNVTGIAVILSRGNQSSPHGNIIGGGPNDSNIIAGNSGSGISLTANEVTRNRISRNQIFSNGSLGIKLSNLTPPLANDVNDPDTLANGRQNYPVISSAETAGGQTTVTGSLNSIPNQNFTIEFFSNSTCDVSGYGEGETFLGSISMNTGPWGTNSFNSIVLPNTMVGNFITATATDANGNTSEFSRCTVVTAPAFLISGKVTNNFNQPMAGVLMKSSFSDPALNRTFTTATNGTYSFTAPLGSTVTVSPNAPNYTFTPGTRTFSNVNAPIVDQNFGGVPTTTIAGRVHTTLNGRSFSQQGVRLTAVGPVTKFVFTNYDGMFNFGPLPAGNYVVTPSLVESTFSPSSANVNLGGIDVQLLFNANPVPAAGRIYFGDIKAINGNGSGETQLGSARKARDFDVSEDGQKVVFVKEPTASQRQICTMAFDGSNENCVLTSSFLVRSPVFSPDGSQIAYLTGGGGRLGVIRVMSATGSGVSIIYTSNNCMGSTIDWSPDGSKIVFDRLNSVFCSTVTDPNEMGIFTISPDGTNLTRLTSFGQKAVFSPDGSKIAFNRNLDFGIMNSDGTNEVSRPSSGLVEDLTWSPDGQFLAFTIPVDPFDYSQGYKIFRRSANLSSSSTNLLTHPFASGPSIAWGPDVDLQTSAGGTSTVGAGAVSVSFSSVQSAGVTTVVPISPSSVSSAPDGFIVGTMAYEVSTTATVTPPINVCFTMPTSTTLASFNAMNIFHSEGGVLVNRTISRNFATKQICAQTTSLSPFVLGEQIDTNLPSITGLVVDQTGTPMAGVSVELTGTEDRATTTDSGGRFAFVNLTPNGSYNVSPKQIGVLFEEYNKDFVDVTTEQTVVFTGTAKTFSISGAVTDAVGGPIAGATVSVEGSASGIATTDANGNYSIAGLPADGFFEVRAAANGTLFENAQIVAPLTGDATGVDFTAFVPTAADGFVSGRVMTSDGFGIRSATVRITDTTNGETRTARTGTFGLYRFEGLETGRTYVVTVSAKRYRFSNDSRIISLTDSVGDADFVANLRE